MECPLPKTSGIFACGSLIQELEQVRGARQIPVFHTLESNLHRTPSRIPAALQAIIDEKAYMYETVILGYGLCSNGVVGVTAPKQGLIIPRVHDCIDLFLGHAGKGKSRMTTGEIFYYLTPGNILGQKDPLNIMTLEYIPKMGEKNGTWGMKIELEHYKTFALIVTDRPDMDHIRQQAKENARVFEKKLIEIPSDLSLVRQLLFGPHDPELFLYIQPGKTIQQHFFM